MLGQGHDTRLPGDALLGQVCVEIPLRALRNRQVLVDIARRVEEPPVELGLEAFAQVFSRNQGNEVVDQQRNAQAEFMQPYEYVFDPRRTPVRTHQAQKIALLGDLEDVAYIRFFAGLAPAAIGYPLRSRRASLLEMPFVADPAIDVPNE